MLDAAGVSALVVLGALRLAVVEHGVGPLGRSEAGDDVLGLLVVVT
jgi:hypothetical protein